MSTQAPSESFSLGNFVNFDSTSSTFQLFGGSSCLRSKRSSTVKLLCGSNSDVRMDVSECPVCSYSFTLTGQKYCRATSSTGSPTAAPTSSLGAAFTPPKSYQYLKGKRHLFISPMFFIFSPYFPVRLVHYDQPADWFRLHRIFLLRSKTKGWLRYSVLIGSVRIIRL